jgi:hypothetical protein
MHNSGTVRKTIAIAFLSLAVGLSGCNRGHKPVAPAADLTPDEYNLFSAYVADLQGGKDKGHDSKQVVKLIVFNMTQSGDDDLLPDENGHPVPWEKTAESLRKKAPALQQKTMDSFRTANFQQAFIHRSFRFPIDYELVDSTQLDSTFKKNGGGWNAYYKLYGSGMVTWSRIGFNADGTQALFYESYRCGGLCGTGRYIVMEKRNGGWVIGNDNVVWVS